MRPFESGFFHLTQCIWFDTLTSITTDLVYSYPSEKIMRQEFKCEQLMWEVTPGSTSYGNEELQQRRKGSQYNFYCKLGGFQKSKALANDIWFASSLSVSALYKICSFDLVFGDLFTRVLAGPMLILDCMISWGRVSLS